MRIEPMSSLLAGVFISQKNYASPFSTFFFFFSFAGCPSRRIVSLKSPRAQCKVPCASQKPSLTAALPTKVYHLQLEHKNPPPMHVCSTQNGQSPIIKLADNPEPSPAQPRSCCGPWSHYYYYDYYHYCFTLQSHVPARQPASDLATAHHPRRSDMEMRTLMHDADLIIIIISPEAEVFL